MNRTRLLALGLLSLGLAACGGATRFSSTWVDPAAGPTDWDGQKVVAFVLSARDSIRLGAEESLARELTSRGAQGVAGHTIVPRDVTEDQDRVRELLTSAGVVGAVVMRVVSQTQEISSSPGTVWYTGSYYPSFYGYWGYGWNAMYQPGQIRSDTIVSIETLLYSVEEDKLLWAGLSKTTNPENIPKFINQLVGAAGKEIRKTGLVEK